MDAFLDIFFTWFHALLIIFNLFGWIIRPLRKLNLITLLLTGGSWFILGIFYGIGYCPITDWHWQVLENLGVQNLPPSYVQYLIKKITGINLSANFAETMTVILYFVALAISVWYNVFRKVKFGLQKRDN